MSEPETLLSPEEVTQARDVISRLLDGLGQAILGQEDLLKLAVTCVLARGHLLLEGLPGLGKTELVKSLSALMNLSFRRVQFTPDLLPGDIVGSPILEDEGAGRRLVFHKGPIFANLLLADEINRATPKTQSALLEAMQERRVTIISKRRHGTPPTLESVVNQDELQALFEKVDRVHLPEAVANYMARLVSATHARYEDSPAIVKQFVRFGASPRAAIALANTARAAAIIAGKPNVGFEEVKFVAPSVLSHRVILDYSARMDGWTQQSLIEEVINQVPEVGRELPADVQA
ncbi:AAA domain-containing protein [bacterium]|nr:AAA domain-containing protein [bacterium]